MTSPDFPVCLQKLAPRWAHFCLGVQKFVHQELRQELTGAHLVVGFSGGTDSLALLLALCALRQRLCLSITAVHVNHMLRPEADAEAEQTRKVADLLQVDFVLHQEDVATLAETLGTGTEDAGRQLRYQIFEQQRQELAADWICTGHQLNDLAEDVLMRLCRGVGWPGLGGMAGVDEPRMLLRPLLLTPRDTLEQFVASFGLHGIEDPSNTDLHYTRNRFRHSILPLFLKENPGFLDTVAGLWKLAAVDQEELQERCDYGPFVLDSADNTITLHRFELAHQPAANRLRIYKECLDKTGPGQALLSQLLELDKAVMNPDTGRGARVIQFPGEKTATVCGKRLILVVDKLPTKV